MSAEPQPPTRRWVTKTDLLRYLRCPYAFWLLDRGEITFEDTVDEFQAELLLAGQEFHELVSSGALPLAVTREELAELMAGSELTLFGVPLFENSEFGIRGQPDGIETAGGALLPIEAKSHKEIQPTDKLELAFYWLLLEPYRTKVNAEPRGILLLRRDGLPERVEVAIRPNHIREAKGLRTNNCSGSWEVVGSGGRIVLRDRRSRGGREVPSARRPAGRAGSEVVGCG